MIFKIRNIEKQRKTVHDFGIKNLIVSGCSFTYNDVDTAPVAWPYYLRDLGGFDQVLDCSLPGAGNSHISDSLIWALEMDQPNPTDSLVIVMWSGHDRDDYIFPKEYIQHDYLYQFHYSKNVMSSITGGNAPESYGNGISDRLKKLSMTKTLESRAIENYLYIAKTYQYLKSLNYKFLFLNFVNPTEPVGGTNTFDIKKYLPNPAKQKLDLMITEIDDPYHFSVRHDFLGGDNFHPIPFGHLRWTKQVLIPHLQTIIT